MLRIVLATIAVLFSTGAMAEPIYLNCEITGDNEKEIFQLKLDEATGKISHTRSSGGAFNADGFFSANSISWQQVISASRHTVSTIQYEIDRTTLGVKAAIVVTERDPDDGPNLELGDLELGKKEGSCSKAEVSERQI